MPSTVISDCSLLYRNLFPSGEMEGGYITHHYIEKGEGFPLILLHGNGEDCSYFEHQIEPFAQYFRVIAIDTSGHGHLVEMHPSPYGSLQRTCLYS